jgi:formylglycine-generating enzyme required for sulfatase activity
MFGKRRSVVPTPVPSILAAITMVAMSILGTGCGDEGDPVPTGDTSPPAAVTDLAAGSPTTTTMNLIWTAPGDDANTGIAAEYDIRYSTAVITEANWDSATQVTGEPTPHAAGTSETFTVTGLTADTPYFFALKTRDEVLNQWSELSNVPTATTQPPATVTTLAACSPTNSTVTLNWTAPGDDGNTGTATEYDIRYSTAEITGVTWASATQVTGEPVPDVAGTSETFTVTGLQTNTLYYFALKTRDGILNQWSGLSNVPMTTTDFVLIPAGTFTMGSPTGEPGSSSDETQHQVTLTRAIYVQTTELTQAQWWAVMGWNDSFFPGVNRPVETVNWFDVVSYCNQRSTREGLVPVYTITGALYSGIHFRTATVTWNQDANGYRLPTEAEWEYACRAGSATAFANGPITQLDCDPVDPNLTLMGWYCGNASHATHNVRGKAPNAWGLYDMHGNVFEFCWDWYGAYGGTVTDPVGLEAGPFRFRVHRGGSWVGPTGGCRSAYRGTGLPEHLSYSWGFRLVRSTF